MEEDSSIIWELLQLHGFRVNHEKSSFSTMNDDTTILVMPIGRQEFVDKSFETNATKIKRKSFINQHKVNKVENEINFLEGLHQYSSNLLYQINKLSLTQSQYDEIDAVIDEGIGNILGRSIVNGYSQFVRGLSQHFGGLGIHRYGTGFGQILYMMFCRYALIILLRNIN